MKSIGLDLDGVLYDWHVAVYDYFCMYKGFSGTQNKFWHEESKKVTDRDWEFICGIDTLYSGVVPSKDCTDFIASIQDRFIIYYITSRPLSVKLTTEQFLRRHHFPFQENLMFTDDKVSVARLLKLDYMIEDKPKNVIDLSKVVFTIMKAQPWNEVIQNEYPTVRNLMQSLKYLEV